jgi:hypothetical protein
VKWSGIAAARIPHHFHSENGPNFGGKRPPTSQEVYSRVGRYWGIRDKGPPTSRLRFFAPLGRVMGGIPPLGAESLIAQDGNRSKHQADTTRTAAVSSQVRAPHCWHSYRRKVRLGLVKRRVFVRRASTPHLGQRRCCSFCALGCHPSNQSGPLSFWRDLVPAFSEYQPPGPHQVLRSLHTTKWLAAARVVEPAVTSDEVSV